MISVQGIDRKAPTGDAHEPFTTQRLLLPDLLDFCNCGLVCLLTSYCKRQIPCKSRAKMKEGIFCQGWKRTWWQNLLKGLGNIWMIHWVHVWEKPFLYNLQKSVNWCVYMCVLSPLPRFCSLADCSPPSLVAASPSSHPNSTVLGLGTLLQNTHTLSGHWTMKVEAE